MTPKQISATIRAALTAIENDLLDPTTGQFKHQPDFADDAKLVSDAETAYLANIGPINDNVKKVIAGVIALLSVI